MQEETLGVAARQAMAGCGPGQSQCRAKWALAQVAAVSPAAMPAPHVDAVRFGDRLQQGGLIDPVPPLDQILVSRY